MNFFLLADDIPAVPSSTEIGIFPALVCFLGIIVWFLHFAAKRKGKNHRIAQVIGYLITGVASYVSYNLNSGLLDPDVWSDANYWNARARFVLIFSLVFPIFLLGVYWLIDFFEKKRLAAEVDDLSVDYNYGKKNLDDDDE